jgi:hypothetical protein
MIITRTRQIGAGLVFVFLTILLVIAMVGLGFMTSTLFKDSKLIGNKHCFVIKKSNLQYMKFTLILMSVLIPLQLWALYLISCKRKLPPGCFKLWVAGYMGLILTMQILGIFVLYRFVFKLKLINGLYCAELSKFEKSMAQVGLIFTWISIGFFFIWGGGKAVKYAVGNKKFF